MYRRKSILNNDEHGVNLDFEMKHGLVLDKDIRKLWGFDSETIPQIILKKRLPYSTGIEFKARHHFYHRNKVSAGAITHEDRIFLSGYKMFGQSFIFNTEFKYRHKLYTGDHYSYFRGGYEKQSTEDLVLRPGLLYFLTNNTLVEGYMETKLNDSYDTRNISTIAKNELIFGAALYLTAF
jgi:hypothetical protein